ncbi:bifunctional adenosylcobinamide kinase/adenosylcobinamide-phosphate guanylyltransferase [Halomonas nitroreducens]|uniref:Bifunctional adenosylcobalamin biosynthesis protein n=1 Tax=Halomonas nitroreducens TaxID=447425 RepID=A0A3S0J961_9GAMM|nr:bifunctional adenosylcobinamide kinase/adenosylcobinamide-phosphate guanylyltransferase [Halomonas nitroreducens]RTR02382.1 bifunctional adenosylcobinamide kinase/adenosylcobinamide-phosphate guanylyltransferase [Halomonas nitroreducens]
MIAFVSGGARSGKSAVAEALARAWRAPGPGGLVYLATARVADDEMAARVARHRRERGEDWVTLEAPLDLAGALAGVEAGSSVLLDCLTLWASQVLFEAGLAEADGEARLQRLVETARRRDIALVVVSNDLNEDLPPRDRLVWRYLAFLQGLHRQLARQADRVIEVVAGQPIDWKGERP